MGPMGPGSLLTVLNPNPPLPTHLFPVNAMQDTELLANATEILSEILQDTTVVWGSESITL